MVWWEKYLVINIYIGSGENDINANYWLRVGPLSKTIIDYLKLLSWDVSYPSLRSMLAFQLNISRLQDHKFRVYRQYDQYVVYSKFGAYWSAIRRLAPILTNNDKVRILHTYETGSGMIINCLFGINKIMSCEDYLLTPGIFFIEILWIYWTRYRQVSSIANTSSG